MPAPRVFVTQQPKPNRQGWTPNLTPAAQYGALHFVFEGGEKPHCDTEWALERAVGMLEDFDHENDYLLWPNTGDPIAAWAVMFAAAQRKLPWLRILYWERKLEDGERSRSEGFYSVVTFYFN